VSRTVLKHGAGTITITQLEQQINQQVNALFELTPEEIGVIEA
jgi:hypothetical protein